jgi:flagellar motor protein MotB
MKTMQFLVISLCILIGFNLQAQITNPYSRSRQVENEIRKQKKKDKEKKENQKNQTASAEERSTAQQSDSIGESPQLVWSKYDFVPGEKVIFEDDLIGEENGEFPSRWDLQYGNVEIAQFGDESVIMFMSGSSCIIPYLKNPEKDYLPDIFTIEFDVYYDVEPHSAKYIVTLYDKKNQSGTGQSLKDIKLFPGGIKFDVSENLVEGGSGLWYNEENPFWRHIAIGFNIRSLKVYYDDVRMLNIPHLGFNPTGLSVAIINTTPVNFYMKNIRIAEGGQKLYDKFLQDGKIIATGIRFDVGKATLKPESMGIINEIVEIMQEHAELNFSIEGHTDSDGDDASNLILSEERAQTVMNTMVKLGISADRLSIKGFGESAPIDTNNTPEGKANNRRVEFI